jgi:hypothetical protein
MAVSARYGEALLWAEELHRNQRRKGKQVPYISHLISVSALVWEDGGTEEQAIAALLHDAIEDAGQSHASISERFGDVVAGIVRDCTDSSDNTPAGKKEPWLLRKTRYIASLEHKPEASLLVTAADKAHNAGDMVLAGTAGRSCGVKSWRWTATSGWCQTGLRQPCGRRGTRIAPGHRSESPAFIACSRCPTGSSSHRHRALHRRWRHPAHPRGQPHPQRALGLHRCPRNQSGSARLQRPSPVAGPGSRGISR